MTSKVEGQSLAQN